MTARYRLNVAADYILAGGVVAYPTEAVYGIGCLPLDEEAVARVVAIKGRSATKGLILIAADLAQLSDFVTLPDGPPRAEIESGWPGPVTWVLPARPGVPALLTGGRDTLAVRVTAHPFACYLSARVGSPLVSTSANRTGRPPARSALAVRTHLGRALDHVIAGPLGREGRPTTIRDGLTGKVLRAG
jgi:L-threonylcarbamoyladenylate synthase